MKFSTAAWMKLPGKKIMEWRSSRSKNYSFSNSYRNTKPRQRRGFQLVEKVRFLFCASCDSTHKIEFAQQIHKNRGRVPRFLYKGRKNVSGGRGFSSAFDRKRGFDREAARKTIVFRQPQRTHIVRPFKVNSRDSAHQIGFAVQILKIRGYVPRSATEKPRKDSVRIFDL